MYLGGELYCCKGCISQSCARDSPMLAAGRRKHGDETGMMDPFLVGLRSGNA